MRRSPLVRRSILKRSKALRSRPQRRPEERGEHAWKRAVWAACPICGAQGRLHHHHVYPERKVREAGGDPWCADNGLYLCSHCHLNHHGAHKRIPLEIVPESAIAFTVDLIGEDRAVLFFASQYAAHATVPNPWEQAA